MSVITVEMLQNEELLRKAERASFEISNCLNSTSDKVGVHTVLTAYLLYKYNPSEISYLDILHEEDGLGSSSYYAISEALNSEVWNKLAYLSERFPREAFALAAFNSELQTGGRKNSLETTPISIIKLTQKILKVADGDRVADLCCGSGAFLVESAMTEKSAEYFGYDINKDCEIVARIRANLVDDRIKIILRNVFDIPAEFPGERFDKIFANYPFLNRLQNLGSGAKFIKKAAKEFPGLNKAKSSDWVFNTLIIEMLKDNGKAVGIMTNGSTWNSMDAPIRKHFVEHGLIESVIALPARMFNYTAIATTLIVFSKGNKSVRMVDATKICQQGRRYNELSDNDIMTIVHALSNDSDFSKAISTEEMRDNEYTLNLSKYLKEEITFTNAVPLGTVIKRITRGAPCGAKKLDEMASDEVTNMQYLKLSSIQDGIIIDDLPYLSYIEPELEKYCLKDKDFILSKNGYPYKTAVANIEDGQKILANGNLYIIELDQEKVNPYYLEAFFESEQGIAVLKNISVGATVLNIGVDALKNAEIPLPPIEEQNKIARRYQTLLDEITIYRIKLEKAINRLSRVFSEERGE